VQAFLSERIVTPQEICPGAVLVDEGRILAIVRRTELPADVQREDVGNAALLPGLVDSHVHINEPGRTDWEGFETATRAAAAGGYTMLVDMPLNCVPATTSVAGLEAKRQAARGKCRVDWAAWGGVVPGNEGDIEALAASGVRGFKCFLIESGVKEFAMVQEPDLRLALPRVARTGLPLLVHAEWPDRIDGLTEQLRYSDWRCYNFYWWSRPEDSELKAIELMLSLCREFGFRLHIVHLSAASALETLQAARANGLPVSVETCPHYLHLEAEKIKDCATQFKCAPPIRGRGNREQLWQGLREGVIDMVVTDHSPCPPEMKEFEYGSFLTAWGGIASLSMALPVMWTEAQRRGFALTDIARWMAENPANLAGCGKQKGKIAVGYDADFAVFDPEAEFIVTKDRLHHRHPISPYLGETLRGAVKRTYLGGQAVYCEGSFPGDPSGQEVRR
jgi:allantoinase